MEPISVCRESRQWDCQATVTAELVVEKVEDATLLLLLILSALVMLKMPVAESITEAGPLSPKVLNRK